MATTRTNLLVIGAAATVLAGASLPLTGAAQPVSPPPPAGFIGPGARIGDYVGEDVMMPMRDGVQLHAEIWRPTRMAGALPILMQRSPYGFDLEGVKYAFETEYDALAKDGFIFVLEDIRGRFGSEGQFSMLHGRKDAQGLDEATDAYDSIAWAVAHIADNNGKVGMFGVSYLGWTTAMAAIHPHPALKALSVQAAAEDMFLGDDFHHNGAFRLDYAWEYATELETDDRRLTDFSFGGVDPYLWYLRQPGLADLDTRMLGKTLPSWRGFVDHPSYDAALQAQVTSRLMPAEVAIPNLIVAGWWDQEDFYGPLTIYRRQQEGDPDHRNVLVVGPWHHGGWASADASFFGRYDLGSNTARYFRTDIELPWFRHWLKDDGALALPHALIFETGSNQWRRYEAWPPRAAVSRRALYFHDDGRLSFDPPSPGESPADRFISDPENPVPYRVRPIPPTESASWADWLADDQAVFSARPDVLTFQTAPLSAAVTLRGDAVARLYASTTGTDADWVVKLIDVYPSDTATPAELRGRQLIIADEVFRGRFRQSFARPEPLAPGVPLAYSIDLHTASHVFKLGHRIEVQVQSSWFPLIDRNPQRFVANILKAPPASFNAAAHALFHAPAQASAILLDIAEAP
jgi:uncharacterized protein